MNSPTIGLEKTNICARGDYKTRFNELRLDGWQGLFWDDFDAFM